MEKLFARILGVVVSGLRVRLRGRVVRLYHEGYEAVSHSHLVHREIEIAALGSAHNRFGPHLGQTLASSEPQEVALEEKERKIREIARVNFSPKFNDLSLSHARDVIIKRLSTLLLDDSRISKYGTGFFYLFFKKFKFIIIPLIYIIQLCPNFYFYYLFFFDFF